MSSEKGPKHTENSNAQSGTKSKKRARENVTEPTPFKKQKKSTVPQLNNDEAVATPAVEKESKKKQKHNQSTKDSTVSRKALNDQHLEKHSPFVHETQSFFLGLSPVSHRFPLEGACAEFISPLLLTYYPPLNGVILSYSNARLSQHPEHGAEPQKVMGKSIDEYAVTYIWLTVDFVIFRPIIGTVLEGFVNLQNQSILGLLCYNYFNAGIEQSRLPKDWNWVANEETEEGIDTRRGRPRGNGHHEDREGKLIEGKILFKVKDFEASAGTDGGAGSINIYGTLLRDEEDARLDAENRQKSLIS